MMFFSALWGISEIVCLFIDFMNQVSNKVSWKCLVCFNWFIFCILVLLNNRSTQYEAFFSFVSLTYQNIIHIMAREWCLTIFSIQNPRLYIHIWYKDIPTTDICTVLVFCFLFLFFWQSDKTYHSFVKYFQMMVAIGFHRYASTH